MVKKEEKMNDVYTRQYYRTSDIIYALYRNYGIHDIWRKTKRF